jgi:hypothetical protein
MSNGTKRSCLMRKRYKNLVTLSLKTIVINCKTYDKKGIFYRI